MSRVYANLTPLVEEMLERAPSELGVDEDASAHVRMEAWLAFAKEAIGRENRLRAYRELADVEAERLAAIHAANLQAAADGLL